MKFSAPAALILILGSSAGVFAAPQLQDIQIQKVQEVEPVSQEVVSVETEDEEWADQNRALTAEEYDKQVFIDMLETLFWDADDVEHSQDDAGRSHAFQ